MKWLKKTPIYKWFVYKLPKMRYTRYLKSLHIEEKTILLESQHGKEINGNIFYLLQTLASSDDYKDYKKYISCRQGNKKKFEKILANYGIKGVTPVVYSTFKYMKLMASAKYLFNDNTFLPFFVKRPGQVYLNTWHGTPLKTLGKGIRNAMHAIGNTQKNFVAADYLLYPNEYTMEHMVEDYMIENIATGKILLGGYPRNTAFLNKKREKQIIEKLGLQGKKIYAYMPTWRGSVGNIDTKANTYLKYYLYELDKQLNDDEVVFVNLHPIAKKNVDFKDLKHIKKFPNDYETYDFLNCADCLITDYSSVFYDYAISEKKIILFTYDEEEYFEDRGVYKPLSELPFARAKTVDELVKEMRTSKQYEDKDFIKEYCNYDNKDASKVLLDLVLFGKKSDKLEERAFLNNGKKNILLYTGNLDQNGITTSVNNLLQNLDRTENNYFVAFGAERTKIHQQAIVSLPDGVNYFPVQGTFNLTLTKKLMWTLCKKEKLPVSIVMKALKKEWKYEIQRIFGGANFDSAIQFNGYEMKSILLFSQFDCNTAIYVHNDMVQEIKTRANQRKDVLEYAYPLYDHVALVTEDLWESTSTLVKSTDKFKIVHNVIDTEKIIRRGNSEIKFDKDTTKSTMEFSKLKSVLESDAKIIVSVGRYSLEKAQKRMIDVFNEIWKENNNTYFIIIGGNQRDGLYDDLCEYVKALPCKNNVVLILSMSNPLPLVKECDGFLLGSFYEGFGLVIVEADVLGVPVVSTDITGPRLFMQKNNGVLVENSPEGVKKGFKMLIDGQVPLLTVNYEEYNRQAVEEFKKII